MRHPTKQLKRDEVRVSVLAGLVVLLIGGSHACSGDGRPDQPGPAAPATTLVLRLAEQHEPLDRPPVVFDHKAHVAREAKTGCVPCHAEGSRGGSFPLLESAWPHDDRDALTQRYHDGCLGCHRERGAGPLFCGECHRRAPLPQPAQIKATPAFGERLHDHHIAALDNKCDGCHHVYDKRAGALTYVEGAEAPCTKCHQRTGSPAAPGIRSASHASCVGCHLERAPQLLKAQAVPCDGCHYEDAP